MNVVLDPLQSFGALVVHSVKRNEGVEATQAHCCFLLVSQTYLGKLLKRAKDGYWQRTISKNIRGKIIKEFVKLQQNPTFCLPSKLKMSDVKCNQILK